MEKEIGKLTKNDTTDIVIRIDDFGGKRGLTVREFVTSERYTGFTKAGVRISPENFKKFKEMINSVSEDEMQEEVESEEERTPEKEQKTLDSSKEEMPDY